MNVEFVYEQEKLEVSYVAIVLQLHMLERLIHKENFISLISEEVNSNFYFQL